MWDASTALFLSPRERALDGFGPAVAAVVDAAPKGEDVRGQEAAAVAGAGTVREMDREPVDSSTESEAVKGASTSENVIPLTFLLFLIR